MKIHSKNRANVLIFVSFLITILTTIMVYLTEISIIYFTKAKLQAVSEMASAAGSVAIGDEIVKYAQTRVDENPDLYTSANPLEIITDEDRANLISNTEIIISKSKEIMDLNLAAQNLSIDSYQIIYPFNYSVGAKNVFIKIVLNKNFKFLFPEFVNKSSASLSAESLSSVNIQK